MAEFKNWKKICDKKDRRIKELEDKFNEIVERLERRREQLENTYRSGQGTSLELAQCNGAIIAIENDIRIIKEVG